MKWKLLNNWVQRYRQLWRPWMFWPAVIAFAIPFGLLLKQAWIWQVATDWSATRTFAWLVFWVFALGGILYFALFTANKEAKSLDLTTGRSTAAITACLFCVLIGWEIRANAYKLIINQYLIRPTLPLL